MVQPTFTTEQQPREEHFLTHTQHNSQMEDLLLDFQ